jgi:hypothetical protein
MLETEFNLVLGNLKCFKSIKFFYIDMNVYDIHKELHIDWNSYLCMEFDMLVTVEQGMWNGVAAR